MADIDLNLLLQKQRKHLDHLIKERNDLKKEIAIKQKRETEVKELINKQRNLVQQIEDGEVENLEDLPTVEVETEKTPEAKIDGFETSNNGISVASSCQNKLAPEVPKKPKFDANEAEDLAVDDESDTEEEESDPWPIRGMMADSYANNGVMPHSSSTNLPRTPSEKQERSQWTSMVADDVEANQRGKIRNFVENGKISRNAAPGFEDRVPRFQQDDREDEVIPQSTAIQKDIWRRGQNERDASPSAKTDVSSVSVGERRKLSGNQLLPRAMRHKSRPAPQIYVPPRNRGSNSGQPSGNGTPTPATERRQQTSPEPVSVNVSFNKRENGPRSEQRFPNDPIQSFRAGEAQANSEPNRIPNGRLAVNGGSSGRLAMDGIYEQENYSEEERGQYGGASREPTSERRTPGPQRIPVFQRLSSPQANAIQASTDVRKSAWGGLSNIGTSNREEDSVPDRDFAFPSLQSSNEPSSKPSVPKSVKTREWDVDKTDNPQEDIFQREREVFNRENNSNWADADPSTPPGPDESSQPFRPAEPSLQGAWGRANLKDSLREGSPFTRLGTVPRQNIPTSNFAGEATNIEAYERQSKLRPHTDNASDAERKSQMRSNRNLEYMDYVHRKGEVNILEGLELHQQVLSAVEQDLMRDTIEKWVQQGFSNQLRGRTFSAPRKWAKGKGRLTVQFGCCYNYAVDKQGRNPGIIAEEIVEPMPPELTALAKRLVRWNVLPKAMEPDSAIVNIYDVGDCIPPHIDHHDFSRPFCTLSLLSEESIMFGQKLVPEGPGEFHGKDNKHSLVSLPVGSCLILNGNGADIAMHCVPPVQCRRMSITLRRMGEVHASRVKAEIARSKSGVWRISENPIKEPEAEDRVPERNSVSLADLVKDKRRQ